MQNSAQKNYLIAVIAIIVVVLIAMAVIHPFGSNKPADSTDLSATSTGASVISVSTGNSSSFAPTATISAPTMAFSVTIATSTYKQDEQIPITVSVLNLTGASTTLSFKNGCIGDYQIGDFDMLAHTTCLTAPASFVVPPHEVKQVKLVHYPSVYKLPTGKYTLRASIIGYGGMSVPITITN